MPRVYLPYVPTRYDPLLEDRVPSIDLKPTARFGSLIELSDRGTRVNARTVDDVLGQIQLNIQDITKEDYVAAIGDPIMIAAAIHHAAEKVGTVRVLRWDRNLNDYETLEVTL